MKERIYTVEITIPEVDVTRNIEDITLNFGKNVIFNVGGKYKVKAPIEKVFIYNEKTRISCKISEEMYKGFFSCDSNRDWHDYELENCTVNGLCYLG